MTDSNQGSRDIDPKYYIHNSSSLREYETCSIEPPGARPTLIMPIDFPSLFDFAASAGLATD